MNREKIIQMLSIGENCEIEFKESRNQIPKSLWSTYSAFANTRGGFIVLGISENKDTQQCIIDGVNNTNNILKDFWNTINNKVKISSNILTDKDINILDINDVEIIVIRVPRANRREKPIYINNNPMTGTFKRNYDGDYCCTKKEIIDMMAEASDTSKDSMVMKDYTIEDLNKEAIENYRNRYKNIAEDENIWNDLSDLEFLKVIGAIDKKTENLTLAGLLVFGNESDITRVLPNYQLDYKELLNIDIEKDERWSHRIVSWNGMWSGNLYDFYRRIIGRLTMDIEVPFALDKDMFRIDTTPIHKAVREALVNSIVHANYMAGGSISVEKGFDYFKFENPGNLRIPFEIAKKGGESDQRNPIIHKIFSLVGLGERTGSGLNMIVKVWKRKNWKEPILREVEGLERIEIILEMTNQNPLINPPINPLINPPIELTETQQKIIRILLQKNTIKIDEIASLLALKANTIKKNIKELKDKRIVEREGNTRNGKWIIIMGK